MAIRFKDVAASAGRVDVVLADVSSSVVGSFTVAPARTGTIARQLDPMTAQIVGQVVANINRSGTIARTMQDFIASVVGSAGSSSATVSFKAGISPQSFVLATPATLDLDTLLQTGAPAAGWAWENPPAGLSLNPSTGQISGSPTTTETRSTVIVASTISPEDAEWNLVANDPANVFATRFDTDADLYGPSRYVDAGADNWYEAYVYGPNGPSFATAFVPGVNPYLSRLSNGGIAGRGAMRLTLPGSWTGANPGGWRRLFIDPNDPSRTWGYGTKFCMRIGIKTDSASLGTWAFDNWKILLLAGAGKSGWGQTCAINEISTFHYGHNTIYNYTRCGSGQMYQPDFPYTGAFRMQNLSDRGAGVTNPDLRYCTYNGRVDVLSGGACYKWRANVWTTLYYEITPNADGSMRFQQWVQYEGATQYTPLYDFLVPNGDWGLQDEAFGGLWNTLTMTLQTTGKNAASGFDVVLDVGEIVIRRGVSIPPRTRWT